MASAEDLACKDVVELVTDYFDDALAPDLVSSLEFHLDACPACATYIEQMRTTIALTGQLREDEIAPEVKAAFLAAVRMNSPG